MLAKVPKVWGKRGEGMEPYAQNKRKDPHNLATTLGLLCPLPATNDDLETNNADIALRVELIRFAGRIGRRMERMKMGPRRSWLTSCGQAGAEELQ